MATVTGPLKYQSAFSPINFYVEETNNLHTSYTMTVSVKYNGKNESVSLERALPKRSIIGPPGSSGVPGLPGLPGQIEPRALTFDVSSVVRNYFGTKNPEMVNDVEVDNRLFVNYTCEGNEYVALNSADDLALAADALSHGEKTLSSLPVFRKYEGYDFDISLLCGSSAVAPFTPNAVNRVKPAALPVKYLCDQFDNFILDESGNYILVDFIDIQNTPVPRNPFYIRWINRHGGVDYWMFGNSQQVSVEIKDPKTLLNYRSGYGQTLSVEVNSSVIVGATGISKKEWEELSMIPVSPHIEYYDKQNEKWVTITAAKSENTISTDLTLFDIEFMFDYPTPKTQF